MIERIDRTGQLDKSHSFDYTTNRRGADCKGQLSIPHVKRLTARVGELLGGQSFLLSSFFIWENFAMTSKVKWITSTIKLSNARMNVRSARVSNRVIRYVRVAASCICFVPWAALASCRPRPQQQLPVSATGGGRCRCSSPSRLRAGHFKKVSSRNLCLFYVKNRKTATRDRKHDHQFCNQRLIVILT